MADRAAEPGSGEDRLIARYFRPLATHPGALGLVDDAAILSPPAGSDLVVTTDALVAGIHFFADDPPELVAKKALRVNLSDLAAKGAKPEGYLLSLALPEAVGDAWLAPFARGLGEDAQIYGCALLGGDSVRTPGPVTLSITAIGTLPRGTMVRRSAARAGDRIVVSGTIGDAALGLLMRREPQLADRWQLDRAQREHLLDRYLLPQPRVAIAEALRRHASAAMDVSDGLAGDLGKLCDASGVSAEIEAVRMPLSDAARGALAGDPALIDQVLTGGDDYEVVATVPAAEVAPLIAAAAAAGVMLTEIGHIQEGHGAPRFLDRAGQAMLFKRLSFSHF
jgi:thiamine-monophosphate kinase